MKLNPEPDSSSQLTKELQFLTLDDYKRLLNLNQLCVVVVTTRCKLLYANEAFLRFIGQDQQSVIGKSMSWLFESAGESGRMFLELLQQSNQEFRLDLQLFPGTDLPSRHFSAIVTQIGGQLKTKALLVSLRPESDLVIAELELRTVQSRCRSLMENSFDGIIMRDLEEGKNLYCNQKFVDLLRVKDAQEILDAGPLDFSPEFQPDGRKSKEVIAENLRLLRVKNSAEFEYTHTRKDGEPLHVQVIAFKMQPPNHSQLMFVLRDISQQKQIEQDLVEKGELYKLIADNVDDIILTSDQDFLITYVSPSAGRILGYKVEELIGRTVQSIGHPEEFAEFVEILESNPVRFRKEFRLISASKEELWFEGVFKLYYDSEGSLIQTINVLRDITERKQMRSQKVEVEQAYRALANHVNHGLATIDMQGKFIYVNTFLANLIGKAKQEIIGTRWRDLTLYSRPEAAHSWLNKGNPTTRYNQSLLTAGGTIEVEVTIVSHFSQQGEMQKSILLIKLLEEQCKNVNIKTGKAPAAAAKQLVSTVKSKSEIESQFVSKLKRKFPELNEREVTHCLYVIKGLSAKEVAEKHEIGVKSVEMARYRLRKKLKLKSTVRLSVFLRKLENIDSVSDTPE